MGSSNACSYAMPVNGAARRTGKDDVLYCIHCTACSKRRRQSLHCCLRVRTYIQYVCTARCARFVPSRTYYRPGGPFFVPSRARTSYVLNPTQLLADIYSI